MSSVLYYSKYCENCKKLLYELGKTNVQKNVHFLSIDKRINRGDKTYIKLDNGHDFINRSGNYKDQARCFDQYHFRLIVCSKIRLDAQGVVHQCS